MVRDKKTFTTQLYKYITPKENCYLQTNNTNVLRKKIKILVQNVYRNFVQQTI